MDDTSTSIRKNSRIESSNQVEIRVENVQTYNGPGVWCSRPSPLGNPYSHKKSAFEETIKVENRSQAISLYEKWLDEQLKDYNSMASREFRRLLEMLKKDRKLVLLCWCVPKKCHLNYVRKKLLEFLATSQS